MLKDIISAFEVSFPNRVHSYYITSSYSDSNRVATSDLDLFVVFKNRLEQDKEIKDAVHALVDDR